MDGNKKVVKLMVIGVEAKRRRNQKTLLMAESLGGKLNGMKMSVEQKFWKFKENLMWWASKSCGVGE